MYISDWLASSHKAGSVIENFPALIAVKCCGDGRRLTITITIKLLPMK